MDSPTKARRTASRRLTLAAAASALVVAVGVTAVALRDDGGPATAPEGAAELVLALPGEETQAACIRFSVEVLANAPVAFSGTATTVRGEDVVLQVDRWYAGQAGEPDTVRLVAPDPRMVPLIGGFEVEVGARYLITANRGAVNLCGFSGPWDPELAAAYEEAFEA